MNDRQEGLERTVDKMKQETNQSSHSHNEKVGNQDRDTKTTAESRPSMDGKKVDGKSAVEKSATKKKRKMAGGTK